MTMNSLEFFACGNPKGQPRVRATMRGRHAGVYDPGTAEAWKQAIRAAAREQWDGVPFNGPVKVEATFNLPRPRSHFRTGKHAGTLRGNAPRWHTGKPDRDNLEKALLDALTALGIWDDDSQVCCGEVLKCYGPQPGVSVRIVSLTA